MFALQRRISFLLLIAFCICAGSVVGSAQNCNPPAITANSQIYNIFSPDQEMVLGDLNYQRMSGDLRFIQDEELLDYVQEIGDKLVRHLPPTGLKFQFFIIDIPTANAFNTPGGYVFLSRKLIAFTRTEDELAGVMAHELGHATVRHAASDMSELFKKILNVTQARRSQRHHREIQPVARARTHEECVAEFGSRISSAARGGSHRAVCDGRGWLRSKRVFGILFAAC